MEEKKNTTEMRSEKVRNIVGQMPRRLIPAALSVIAAVLLLCGGIAYFLPYKEVYAGTAVLSAGEGGRSVAPLKLRFLDKRPSEAMEGMSLTLLTPEGDFSGELLTLESRRDTLGRQSASVAFDAALPEALYGTETDFTLSTPPRPLLYRILKAKR